MRCLKLCLVMIISLLLFSCSSNNESTDEKTTPEEIEAVEPEEEVQDDGIKDTSDELTIDKKRLEENDKLFKSYAVEELDPIWSFSKLLIEGNWSEEEPLLKPFIGEENYTDIQFYHNYEVTFTYVDKNQHVRNEKVSGDYWSLKLVVDESKAFEDYDQFAYDLKRHLTSNGASLLGEYGDKLVFGYEDNDYWWMEITIIDDYIYCDIVKEVRYDYNQMVSIKPDEMEDNDYFYSVIIPEGQFLSFEVLLDEGSGTVEVVTDTQYGDYSRHTEFYQNVISEESDRFVSDDFLYEPGRARIYVYWSDDDQPKEITLKMDPIYDVEPINYGEELGGIMLTSDLVHSIEIIPTAPGQVYLEHPDFYQDALYFDKNQEDAFVTYAPAGYYDLELGVEEGLVSSFRTLRVPIHSGKMTMVEVPENVTNAFKQDEAFNERGIAINTVEELEDQVTFVFSLVDAKTRAVMPDKENSEIYEGGMPCEIISIEPVPSPPSVVLLLDSSGSMKGQMDNTIEAAKLFIQSLPNDADIKIIDFDTTIKPLNGTTVTSLLEELDNVSAKGATALYDAVLMGLNNLENKKRPALVVFTDGEDANLNDTAQGSVASLESTLREIEMNDIPVYTIGFGEGHDGTTLKMFSNLSLGNYYPADNQEALSMIFKAINDRLSNTYVAQYKRPKEASVSDIPVVSIIVDVSGSMEGSRMINVKNICHDFIQALPDDVQIMITTFNGDVSMQQGVTTNKMLALNAVGNFEAGGATNITDSVVYGYEALSRVPSSKRAMIYITDAALDDVPEEMDYYKEALKSIKEDDIEALWVGIGVDYTDPFENVAFYTEGDYVVTEDSDEIYDKLMVMLDSVKQAETSDDTLISLSIKKRTDNGVFESFSSSLLYHLSPIKKSDEVIIQDTIAYSIDDQISQYDQTMSKYVSGESVVANETIISKRIDSDVESSNEAMKVHIDEIIFLSKLNGVLAPNGQRFMGVLLDMDHILPEQEVIVYPDGSGHPSNWVTGSNKGEVVVTTIPYVIPNFTSHFGMSYNGVGPYPAATATWLTYEPVVVPGEYDITLNPEESKTGMMVFIVPDEPLTQLGIHYFDDDYGYFNIPVVSVLPELDTSFHPKTNAASKLYENFELTISGYYEDDFDEVEQLDNSQFRVIEGNFKSEVKANLNIEPHERIFMRTKSDNGDFYLDLSERTAYIPFGMYGPTTIMPGGRNPIKLVFQMPKSLSDNKTDLFIDLYEEDVVIPVTEGSQLPSQKIDQFTNEYFDADINNVYRFSGSIDDYTGDWIIADVTIHDIKDGFATTGVANNFSCGFTPSEEPVVQSDSIGLGNFASNTYGYDDSTRMLSRSEGTLGISNITSDLIFGLDSESIIYDGTSRRGVLVFQLEEEHLNTDMFLMFDDADLNLLVESNVSDYNRSLLTAKEIVDLDYTYAANLDAVLPKVIETYKLKHPTLELTKKISEVIYDEVNMPSINSYGYKLVETLDTEAKLIEALRSLRYLTNESVEFSPMFSKEAVLTQGFGTESDFAQMATEVLSRLGYKVKRRQVQVTDRGLEILRKMSGQSDLRIETLPALSYKTDQGEKMLVLPYARDISELEGIVYYVGHVVTEENIVHQSLNVYFDVIPTEKGHLAQLNTMAGALAGSSDEEEEFTDYITSFSIPLTTFSEDAVDIGCAIIGRKVYMVLHTADGVEVSEEYVDLAYYQVTGWSVNIDNKSHHVKLTEEMLPDQVFMTIGYNLPELPSEAATLVSDLMDESKSLTADTLSSMKWIHRKALYNFISSQTAFEHAMDDGFELVTGRIHNPRFIVVQSKIDDELIMSMDLVQIQNDIHNGDEETKNSYRLMSGLSASQMEANAIPNGMGFEAVWSVLPESANLVLMDTRTLDLYTNDLIEIGLPDEIIEYFEGISKMVIIQSEPSIIRNEKRWAWMEIDPWTYETISVLDTFERGTLASNASLNSALEKAQYSIGAFKGVESSVWAVSAFSLELSDYNEIIKQAKAFALGIANNFEAQVGSVTIGVGKLPELNGRAREIQDQFKKGGKNEDSEGFKEGYIDGVNLYFKLVEMGN